MERGGGIFSAVVHMLCHLGLAGVCVCLAGFGSFPLLVESQHPPALLPPDLAPHDVLPLRQYKSQMNMKTDFLIEIILARCFTKPDQFALSVS